nr:unnamed protein product [Callosobruchus chinensis]
MAPLIERTHDKAHEEADTKIVFHVCQIDYEAYVTIRCSDTDVAIIMLANMSALNNANVKVSMEVGVSNNQRFINISKLYETLGPKLSATLPAFHALTGCDYNPAFFKKEKVVRIKFYATLKRVCLSNVRIKKIDTVNEARVAIFLKTYNILRNDDIFRLPKNNIDGLALPPAKLSCTNIATDNLHRKYLGTRSFKLPTTLHPTGFGWKRRRTKNLFSNGSRVNSYPPTLEI